jgi:hypothetical protein
MKLFAANLIYIEPIAHSQSCCLKLFAANLIHLEIHPFYLTRSFKAAGHSIIRYLFVASITIHLILIHVVESKETVTRFCMVSAPTGVHYAENVYSL